MKVQALVLALALLALPARSQEGPDSNSPTADREVSVELTPWSTTFRVVEDGAVVDLREVSTPGLPCGVVSEEESFGLPAELWAGAKKPPQGPQVVDVLVLYSPKALQQIGARDLVVALADSFIQSMNQDIYPGSGVANLTLRIVGVVPAPWFREDNPSFTDKALTKALKKHGADIPLILAADLGGNCGRGAYLTGAIVRWDCGAATVSHELGHVFVQGLHDQCFVQCSSAAQFGTIECEDASKIPPGCFPSATNYYSNVSKLLFDLPMGDTRHNSAKVISTNAPKVAAIRKPKKSTSSR